jgi:hypothetical protein
MINIAERPAEAEDRAVPGHWEGDLIIGRKNLSAIGTLVERTSNYTMLLHLPDGYTPELVRDALAAKIKTLPEVLRASLTWDQGPEMRDWKTSRSLSSLLCKACGWLQVGVDSVGVDEGELGEGLFPVGGDLAFDEVPFGFASGAAAEAGFLGAVPRPFVFDGADGQPQQFDHGIVVGEVAAVLDDLAQLIVQRLAAVGGVDDLPHRRRELQKRDEPLRATRGRTCQVDASMGGCGDSDVAQVSAR